MGSEVIGQLYGLISKGGMLRRVNHNELEGRLANNSHFQYLDGNTKIFTSYNSAPSSDFICRNDADGTEIAIVSIDSQDIDYITFNLAKTPITTASIFCKSDLSYKWKAVSSVGVQLTINGANQEIIVADNTKYIDRNTTGYYATYDTGLFSDFSAREHYSGSPISITSIDSQDAEQITLNLISIPSEKVDVFLNSDDTIRWEVLDGSTQKVIINKDSQSIHTSPESSDVNTAVNHAFDRIERNNDKLGTNIDSNKIDYNTNYLLTDDDTIKASLETFDYEITNKYKIVTNASGTDLIQYKIVKADTLSGEVTAKHISDITETPYGIVIDTIPDTESAKILQEGKINVVGFDTTGATVGDIVYCDATGSLTLTVTALEVGQVLTLATDADILMTIGMGGSGLGSRDYTNQYLVEDFETLTESIDKLDSALNYTYAIGHNKTGSTLAVNRLVKITGEEANNVTVEYVSSFSDEIYGVTQAPIDDGEYGRIVQQGIIATNLNTTSIPINTFVYATTAGVLTLTETEFVIGQTVSQETFGKVHINIYNYLYEEFYLEEFGYEGYQDITAVATQDKYNITKDENCDTAYTITEFGDIVNNLDLFSITTTDYKPMYAENTIFKTPKNLVKVTAYDSGTGEITLNKPPKTDFRVNYTIKYSRKNVPDGKLILASNIQNIIERDENEEEELIKFDTGADIPTHEEGVLFYHKDNKALTYYNDEDQIDVPIGQKAVIRVKNETGAVITKGSVVYPSGGSGTDVTIGLANANEFSKNRLVGVVAHDIPNTEYGYVVKFGRIDGLATDAYNVGDILYLSTTDGQYTDVKPTGEAFVIQIGRVNVSDSTLGSIYVDISVSELSVEVTDTNGFAYDRDAGITIDSYTGTTMSFDDATRTFSINPLNTYFHFYERGVKYRKDSTQSVIIDDTEGLHMIYFEDGTLKSKLVNASGQIEPIIRNNCIVSYIYWDAVNKQNVYFGEERHGISMSPETHIYLHKTRGAQYLSGFAIGDIQSNQSGDDNTHAQFSVTGGEIVDEDITNTVPSLVPSIAGLPIFYLEGAELKRSQTNFGYSILTAGTGRMAYNENVAGNWQLSEISNNDFGLCHVFAVNNYENNKKIVAVVGQNDYPNLSQARAGAMTEITSLIDVLITAEAVPIATVIFQTGNGYSNAVKSRIRTTDTGEDYIDWRTVDLTMGNVASDHNNLAGLQLATDTVTYGHISDQTQTIYGDKTFQQSFAMTQDAEITTVGQLDDVSTENTSHLRFTQATSITGFGFFSDGKRLVVHNANSVSLKIEHNSASSNPNNRISTVTGQDISVLPNETIEFVYDTGSSFWKMVDKTETYRDETTTTHYKLIVDNGELFLEEV